jgi:hypothetical protein
MRLGPEHLVEREPLPGGADLGMQEECLVRIESEKLVQKAGVADVDLRRSNLPLLQGLLRARARRAFFGRSPTTRAIMKAGKL